MGKINEILKKAVEAGASDIFVISGIPVSFKINGHIEPFDSEMILPPSADELISQIYELAGRNIENFRKAGDDDFSLSVRGLSRFRISAYMQRNSPAAVIRVILFSIPEYKKICITEEVMNTVRRADKGLLLVTGPAGSGKTTTIACMIDELNKTREGHIITLEEPIEYIHRNKKSVISQREVPADTESFVSGLRACMRQSPDIILLGEMRDYETIKTAMTASETGHLVISTLHTVGAANSIDRIIDVFPPNGQQQIRVQLSMLLQSVISQQLIPMSDGITRPVFEIMNANSAVRNIIREGKTHLLDNVISSSAAEGMQSMDAELTKLYKQKNITSEQALKYCLNYDVMKKRISQ